MVRVDRGSLVQLARRALQAAGASEGAAISTAHALVSADAQGIASHGVSRVPQYVEHLRFGRVDGAAIPAIVKERGGALLIDAREGFAYPALQLAARCAIERVPAQGVVLAAIANSHHFGVAAHMLHEIGEVGLVGLAFGNSPAAIPAWGGRQALFGTNPVAAVFPRKGSEPLVIDMSLSEVARGKLLIAARENREIPIGWALDSDGNPTTDPKAGLAGMMCPAGGVKGAMLALVVELLCVALTGSSFGFEADSFFASEGNRPRIGQALIVIDPGALAGQSVYSERVESLVAAMLQDDGVRLPGSRRQHQMKLAGTDGIEIPSDLLKQLQDMAFCQPSSQG